MTDWERLFAEIDRGADSANSANSTTNGARAPANGTNGTNGTGISPNGPAISIAPLDAAGVPCGPCPKCGGLEFWRHPCFHPEHDPRAWRCDRCNRPVDIAKVDWCGVPDPAWPEIPADLDRRKARP